MPISFSVEEYHRLYDSQRRNASLSRSNMSKFPLPEDFQSSSLIASESSLWKFSIRDLLKRNKKEMQGKNKQSPAKPGTLILGLANLKECIYIDTICSLCLVLRDCHQMTPSSFYIGINLKLLCNCFSSFFINIKYKE